MLNNTLTAVSTVPILQWKMERVDEVSISLQIEREGKENPKMGELSPSNGICSRLRGIYLKQKQNQNAQLSYDDNINNIYKQLELGITVLMYYGKLMTNRTRI